MFRSFARIFLPNPLDWMVKRCAKRGGKKILLAWNRGLGDIALGLYAMVQRIREIIPDAEITFLTRPNLQDGFTLLDGVKTFIAPDWKRGESTDIKSTLERIGVDPKSFDFLIEKPSPTDWVRWQRGKVVPRLKWNPAHDDLWKRFDLPDGFTYIGVQAVAETNYGLWRNWPLERWNELFERLVPFESVKVLLFGFGDQPAFPYPNLIDSRGKTTLFELLSILKNRCSSLILPDSGVLSMAYYLDASFPIQAISLWADPDHGILKQAVSSPNPQLVHHPIIGAHRDLSSVTADTIVNLLFPVKPLYKCSFFAEVAPASLKNTGTILLAGGQGSRLGHLGPKGTFSLKEKSLFQWICERAPRENFPIAIMTSPLNHEETVEFFAKHLNFGREIYFFQQELLPFLDEEKRVLPIPHAPDGNGSLFKSFVKSGLAETFSKKGIDSVTIVPVENPLADPADRRLIAYHRNQGVDIALKCVKREKPDESMGALVERGQGRLEIVEYHDLDPRIMYPYSNTGMMSMSLSFLIRMAGVDLPIHWIKKKPPGEAIPWAWKREKFIFDVLPYTKKAAALCYPRTQCYAPIKNLDSIQTVEKLIEALQQKSPQAVK